MSDFLSRAPFAKFLVPVIVAIILSTYCPDKIYPTIVLVIGAAFILLSFFFNEKRQYSLRWVFGFGIYFVLFAFTSFSFQYRISRSEYLFHDGSCSYIGVVSDLPQIKPKSIAYNIQISYPINKKIVAYFQPNASAQDLKLGEEIVFRSKVDCFRNFGNPDDFDYERYMKNKGFAGSAYVASHAWQKTGKINKNVRCHALDLRRKMQRLYESFDLDYDAYSFISALTLGHKEELSNDLKEAFRVSGTSHVLAVSGLHVGIIYAALLLILSFLNKSRKQIMLQQVLIICALWLYALLTGLSPSVIRATVMLSIVSVGLILDKKVFTYNAVFASAFIILLINPPQLFDVGFQMSYAAVLSILYINPLISRLIKTNVKLLQYVWGVFSVSISAQLGVFPIALYYFGTFPIYFFVANLVIVPIVSLVVYSTILVSLFTIFATKLGGVFAILLKYGKVVLSTLITIVLKTVYYIESIPYSQITNLNVTLIQTLVIVSLIYLSVTFVKVKSPKSLIVTLIFVLVLSVSFIVPRVFEDEGQLVVFNTPNKRDIGLYIYNERVFLQVPENGYIPHDEIKILSLTENRLDDKKAIDKSELDILILSNDNTFSIKQLYKVFGFKQVVTDSSVPSIVRKTWAKECSELGVKIHDVSKHGAFFINL